MDWVQQDYRICFLGILCTVIMGTASGHGRLTEPASRVSCWRFGYETCAQPEAKLSNITDLYTDTQWNCGGRGFQISRNGRCGVCGDPDGGPYESEAGGVYATGTIVRSYQRGTNIKVNVLITAQHMGYMEFKLCPVKDMNEKATQECFDKYPLRRTDGAFKSSGITSAPQNHLIDLVLPADLTCPHCVMQWHYRTGNSNSLCPNGTSAFGCGPQENFYACADICIEGNGVTCPKSGTPQVCNPTCINGKCVNRKCVCDEGYTGSSCLEKKTDSGMCNPACVNGRCVNGACQCNNGYTGTSCNEKNTGSGSFTCTSSGYFSDPNDCNKFIQCVSIGGNRYMAYPMTCPGSLYFNPKTNTCDWPFNVQCQ